MVVRSRLPGTKKVKAPPEHQPLYHRAWLLLPLLVLAGACTADTLLETDSQGDLVPIRETWTVMGTILEATVYRPSRDTRLAQADLEAVHTEVLEIDQLMSLYRPESELVALNTRDGTGPIRINTPTLQILEASEHYRRLSGGALDISIQPLVELWGFYRMERTSIPPPAEIQAALGKIGADRLEVDQAAQTAMLATGSRLDLGGIAKGYAIDRAIAALGTREVPAALIDLGGNIGVLGQPPGGRRWSVGIQHPRESYLAGLLRFRDGAVATSGDYDRYFEVQGRRFSHLLDPRTGWPAEDLYAVTVIAPNATAADALSTAAFILGPDEGMALLAACQGVEGVLIQPEEAGNQARLLVVTTIGSTPEEGVSFALESETETTLRRAQTGAEPSSLPECVWPISLED